MIMDDASLAKQMNAKTMRFRSQMEKAGFTLAGDNHAICPVMLGDAKLASTFADAMLGKLIHDKTSVPSMIPTVFSLEICFILRDFEKWAGRTVTCENSDHYEP